MWKNPNPLKSENIKKIKENLHKYASEGLRTLLVGKREISKDEFEKWNKEHEVIIILIRIILSIFSGSIMST